MRQVAILKSRGEKDHGLLRQMRRSAAANSTEEVSAASERIVKESGYRSIDHYLMAKVAEFRRRGK